jgi:cytochrome P450
MDPPEHTVFRQMFTKEFLPRQAEAMRPEIQTMVDKVINEMLAAGPPIDLFEVLASPVPSMVICRLLGVPYEDREFFQAKSKIAFAMSTSEDDTIAAYKALTEYVFRLVKAKVEEPTADDLLGRFITNELLTGHVTDIEAATNTMMLLMAGHETTQEMIALGTLALLRNPEQADRLNRQPSLAGNAVEELMRYLTVAHLAVARTALEDVEVGGEVIRKGDGVFLLISSANRDEGVFSDPDALDIGRPNARQHLGFGYGIHNCIGASLARVELEVVFQTLFRRVASLRLDLPFEEIPFKNDRPLYGVYSLPVSW